MPSDTKRIWDACGEAFDRYTTAGDSFSENIERPAIGQLLGEVAGARALDLGCGSGTYTAWLSARGADVTGLDLSATMLSIAARRASEQARFDLCLADINEPLPFEDATFELVFTATALHYIRDLDAALSETARVLGPGGRLVASVLHPMSTSRFPIAGEYESAESRWELRREWQAQYFGSPKRTIETPWLGFGDTQSDGRQINCRHHTIGDYFRAIKNAGLTPTEIVEPAPPEEFAIKNPERYREAAAVPVYLIFSAKKSDSRTV
jgi:SAM-dependent methyltransferase